MYYPRFLSTLLLEYLQYFPIVSVIGARQVGKSTMVEEVLKENIHTITFDPVQDIGGARQDPDLFLQSIKTPVFLDEIQYAPELLASLKKKVDREKKNGMFILSGSQNFSVLKNISESLAGRVLNLTLFPMSYREIKRLEQKSFLKNWVEEEENLLGETKKETPPSSFEHMWRGGHPRLLEVPDNLISKYWESYFQTYIERDVRSISNIGSLQTFGSFFKILSALTAQEINPSQLGRDLGIDRNTAKAWLAIAESSYQWIEIPAYSQNLIKKVSAKKKGYFTDTGFVCSLQKISSPLHLMDHPIKGSLFETFVVMEIVKAIQSWKTTPNLFHFRTYHGAEVDLILELNGELFPIEIKLKSNPSKRDLKGFQSFRESTKQNNIKRNLLICSTEFPRWIDEQTYAIPWWWI